MRQLLRFITVLLAVIASLPILAQAPTINAVRLSPSLIKTAGGSELMLEIDIKKPYHVNANPASESFLIPTKLTIKAAPGLSTGTIDYPKPKMVAFAFTSGKKIAVYAGATSISVPVTITADYKSHRLSAELSFQACDEMSCYAPQTIPFEVALPSGITAATAASPTATSNNETATNRLTGLLTGKHLFTAIPLIFLLGLLLNLTPCVYPIIPITIAFFARESGHHTSKQLGLSAIYVLGIAIMYAVLGTAAALLGKTFGFQLQNPWVVGGFTAVLVALALSMFGLYELQMPASWRKKSKLRDGYLGAFSMGLLVGIAAAPCVGPVVIALATAVSAMGSIALGFGLFFVLGLGLGFPYLVLGAFSSKIKSLPRSGDWMVAVERIFGLMLLSTAAYLVQPILPKGWDWTLPAVIALCGVYLNMIDRHAANLKGFSVFKRALGLVAVVASICMLKPATAPTDQPIWQPYTAGTLPLARTTKQPVVMDFYADWCIPCKELDSQTFSNPEVRHQLAEMSAVKVDLTRDDNPVAKELKLRYGIKGVPTIVFIDSNGQERKDLRLTGFEPANQFILRLNKLQR